LDPSSRPSTVPSRRTASDQRPPDPTANIDTLAASSWIEKEALQERHGVGKSKDGVAREEGNLCSAVLNTRIRLRPEVHPPTRRVNNERNPLDDKGSFSRSAPVYKPSSAPDIYRQSRFLPCVTGFGSSLRHMCRGDAGFGVFYFYTPTHHAQNHAFGSSQEIVRGSTTVLHVSI
jgi:hypothetical protein